MFSEGLVQLWRALVAAIVILLQKMPSTKWIAFTVATHMTYIALLDPQSWLMIAMLYMGVEGALAFQRKFYTNQTEPTSSSPQEDSQMQGLPTK